MFTKCSSIMLCRENKRHAQKKTTLNINHSIKLYRKKKLNLTV